MSWTRVATVMPNYREAQDWLRLNRKLMEII
jgi:predicted metal-dependent hydrolase